MFRTKKCKVCGKEFILPAEPLYRLLKDKKRNWYCSYTCWRKDGGDNGKQYNRAR